jgi:hypothetical protein
MTTWRANARSLINTTREQGDLPRIEAELQKLGASDVQLALNEQSGEISATVEVEADDWEEAQERAKWLAEKLARALLDAGLPGLRSFKITYDHPLTKQPTTQEHVVGPHPSVQPA